LQQSEDFIVRDPFPGQFERLLSQPRVKQDRALWVVRMAQKASGAARVDRAAMTSSYTPAWQF
jgi:hypothetical protein